MTATATLERDFFRTLNAFIEPLAESGLFSPGLLPSGLILLETTGRRSGRPRRVPLLATLCGWTIIAGTVRGSRSHWVANVRANSTVRYWLGGQQCNATARVLDLTTTGLEVEDIAGPLCEMARAILLPATKAGWAFIVIEPQVHMPA